MTSVNRVNITKSLIALAIGLSIAGAGSAWAGGRPPMMAAGMRAPTSGMGLGSIHTSGIGGSGVSHSGIGGSGTGASGIGGSGTGASGIGGSGTG